MEFSFPIFFVVLVLGILQLAVGVFFGKCLPVRESNLPRGEQRNVRRIRSFAARLYRLVNSVADDVDQHQTQIRQVNEELASAMPEGGGGLTEFVLRTVAQIVHINERLQERLSAAEEKLQRQTEQIESQIAQARTDALTGLPNRRAFDDELGRRVAEWKRKCVTFCLMMIDIDHFKRLNDRHGHPTGDHALREIAEVLGKMIREMDMVARVGGEEFAVILPSTNSRDAVRTAERTRLAVASEKYVIDQTDLPLTVSVGLTAVKTGDDSLSLIKRADAALYCAKRAGRNCGFFHDGRKCRRMDLCGLPTGEPAPNNTAGRDPEDSSGADAAEMAVIYSDLRSRLAEVTDEAVQSPIDTPDGR